MLIITAVCLSAGNRASGGDRPSIGRKIGELARKADGRIQEELDRRPHVRAGIARAIDTFADNVIDAVEPGAPDDARRLARNGVQMLLNPSRSESDRALSDMHSVIVGQVAGNRGRGAAHTGRASWAGSSSSTTTGHAGPGHSTSGSAVGLPPAILVLGQADWHHELWRRADHGLLAASQAISGGLSRTHAHLTGSLAEAGLSVDAASTLGTVAMGLAGLFGLYLLLFFPRRRLKRQVRRLRQQLELARARAL